MHKLPQFCHIYKHLLSIIGINHSLKIIVGNMTYWNKRSEKDQENNKNQDFLLKGMFARASLHACG
jgi:hypothetical protein